MIKVALKDQSSTVNGVRVLWMHLIWEDWHFGVWAWKYITPLKQNIEQCVTELGSSNGRKTVEHSCLRWAQPE